MSEIADELRKLADSYGSGNYQVLYDFAYRIDAEMVELPVGADGEPILPGQTVYDGEGPKLFVRSLSLTDDGWSVICETGSSFESLRSMEPSRLSRERQDSWERIADDVETLVWFDDEDEERSRRELAARIRRMARKGGGSDD